MAVNVFKKTTQQKILEKLKLSNVYLDVIAGGSAGDPDIDSYEDIQRIVQLGIAPKVFAIGDQIITTYTDTSGKVYEMPWDIVHFDNVELEDDSIVPGMFIQSHYGLYFSSIRYDAAEKEVATEETAEEGLYYYGYSSDDSTYTLLDLATGDTVPYDEYTYIYHNEIEDSQLNVVKSGYYRWSHSAARQQLNSAELAGNWWKAQHVGDVAPTQANTLNGFMASLESDFLAMFKPVKVTTILNNYDSSVAEDTEDTYDTFFLPSKEQWYGGAVSSALAGVEGTYFEYWKEVTGLSAPSENTNSGRITYSLTNKTQACHCFGRTAWRDVNNISRTWCVSSNGQMGCQPASSNATWTFAPVGVIC